MQFRGWKLAPWGSESKRRTAVRGQIENASCGGVSVLSSRLVPISSLVRCELKLSQSAAVIPTLMQVRWIQKTMVGELYRIGLQFIP
jgi:c-di-GMP-binding flagellar brake protein YcgR